MLALAEQVKVLETCQGLLALRLMRALVEQVSIPVGQLDADDNNEGTDKWYHPPPPSSFSLSSLPPILPTSLSFFLSLSLFLSLPLPLSHTHTHSLSHTQRYELLDAEGRMMEGNVRVRTQWRRTDVIPKPQTLNSKPSTLNPQPST